MHGKLGPKSTVGLSGIAPGMNKITIYNVLNMQCGTYTYMCVCVCPLFLLGQYDDAREARAQIHRGILWNRARHERNHGQRSAAGAAHTAGRSILAL